jgi:hypothetical protein
MCFCPFGAPSITSIFFTFLLLSPSFPLSDIFSASFGTAGKATVVSLNYNGLDYTGWDGLGWDRGSHGVTRLVTFIFIVDNHDDLIYYH